MGRSSFSHFFTRSAFGSYEASLGAGNTNRSTASSASRSKGGEDEVAADAPTTRLDQELLPVWPTGTRRGCTPSLQ